MEVEKIKHGPALGKHPTGQNLDKETTWPNLSTKHSRNRLRHRRTNKQFNHG